MMPVNWHFWNMDHGWRKTFDPPKKAKIAFLGNFWGKNLSKMQKENFEVLGGITGTLGGTPPHLNPVHLPYIERWGVLNLGVGK